MSLETAGDGVKKAQTMERSIASHVQCSPYASGGKTKARHVHHCNPAPGTMPVHSS